MALQPPTRLGPYEVVSLLGAGGMGEVYRARDPRLKRDVAIKLLAGAGIDPAQHRRLLDEAQAASALNHPNIVTVHDVGTQDGVPYVVSEIVEGTSLRAFASRAPLPVREVLDLAVQMADGLAAAHRAGIVHRDFKPENVMVTRDGRVKILDFGLALVGRSDVDVATETVTHRAQGLVGTVPYMSPEQARGAAVDFRSDQFSLGSTLYELVAGRRAFRGETAAQVLAAILDDEPEPIAAINPKVPAPVRWVIERCLAKDARQRYDATSDLAREIRTLRDRVAEFTPPADMAPETPHRRGRRRLAMAVLGVTVALLAAVGGWLIRGWAPESGAPDNPLANATFTRFTDFPGTELDAAISPDGRFVAFASDRDGPLDVWLSQVGTFDYRNLTPDPADQWFNRVRSVGFSADGSEIWIGGGTANSQRMSRLPMMGGTPQPFLSQTAINVAWSPDGARMVFHTRDPGDPMFVADGNGANARQIFVDPPAGHHHYPAWSFDGEWIYFVRGIFATYEMDIWRIRPDGGQPERMTNHNSDVAYLTPIDRRTLLYVTRAEDRSGPWLWALDVDTRLTRRISVGLEKYTSIAASADGRRLVATVANPTASLWSVPILDRDRVAEERDVKPFPVPSMRALAPRFGEETLFYLSSRGGGDGVWRLKDALPFEVWKAADGALLEPPAVSRDGRRVAVVLRKQGRLHLEIVSADGTEPHRLAEAPDVRGAANWSSDSKWIVTGGSDAKGPGLFKIPVAGGSPVKLGAGPAFNPVWSPDDTLIVYTGANTGADAPLLAMRPDGTPVDLPPIRIRNDGERFRFLDGKRLVYMQGYYTWQDFWLLDLVTKKSQPLTRLAHTGAMRTFDISPDGQQIVFDRLRENSDIVLIDRPPSPASIR